MCIYSLLNWMKKYTHMHIYIHFWLFLTRKRIRENRWNFMGKYVQLAKPQLYMFSDITLG